MAARKARKTTSKRPTGRKPARTGTKTSKRPKPKPAKAEKARKKKKAPAPARKKAPARAAKPKKAVRAKPKKAVRAKPKKALRAKPKKALRARPKPAARKAKTARKPKPVARKPKAVVRKAKPKARPKAKPKAAVRKPKPKASRKPVKKVARKAAPSRKKPAVKKVAKARKTVARKTQRLADLREQRRQRRLAEKESRKAAKADKLKTDKLKAEKLKAEKRERIERIRAAKRERIERLKAEKLRKAEKLKAEKLQKAERLKAEKLQKAEKLKAEKLQKAEAQKHEAPPVRSSKPGVPDRKSVPGTGKAPTPAKGAKGAKGKESERPGKSPSQPPRARVPLMRAPAVVIPKEAPRPPVEERAASVESRLQEQPSELLREYEERLFMSWIHHDSALEGVVYTFQELQMAVDPAITVVADSSIQPICDEIRRHKQAIDFVREQAKLKEPVSSDLIKRIYLFLHPEEGDLKTVKYRKDIPQHRLYFHEYAAPDKIAYGVRQVVEWINDPETARTRGALRIAARAHYDFIRIFPFQTDSGKVARLLMNYVLMLAGFPPAIIHSTERQRYYEALKGSPLSVLHMVTEALENSVASIEKFLNERATRVRSFVS